MITGRCESSGVARMCRELEAVQPGHLHVSDHHVRQGWLSNSAKASSALSASTTW